MHSRKPLDTEIEMQDAAGLAAVAPAAYRPPNHLKDAARVRAQAPPRSTEIELRWLQKIENCAPESGLQTAARKSDQGAGVDLHV